MGGNDSRGGVIFYPKGMISRICVKPHITMLHNKYRSFGSCGKKSFQRRRCLCISRNKPMANNDAPGVDPVLPPVARLAGFIKRAAIHCYKI